MKKAFAATDKVGSFYVFNIGGNKFRVMTAIHFNTQIVYVRHVYTQGVRLMEGVSESITIAEITSRFAALAAMIPMHPIGNRAEYRRATSALNQLLDAGAADENHELAPLVTMLGMLIEAYENRTAVNDKPSPAAVLKLLMEQHELTQSELPVIGSQGVVSEILRGKRHLNLRQVKALSERFHVPADVFI